VHPQPVTAHETSFFSNGSPAPTAFLPNFRDFVFRRSHFRPETFSPSVPQTPPPHRPLPILRLLIRRHISSFFRGPGTHPAKFFPPTTVIVALSVAPHPFVFYPRVTFAPLLPDSGTPLFLTPPAKLVD